MKIGIDLDNVIIDYIGGFCRFYNDKEGADFSIDDFTSYNIWEIIGGTRWKAVNLVKEFYYSDFFDKIELIEGAREGLIELSEKHDPYIITARFKYSQEKTNKFFDKCFSDISLKTFFTGFVNARRGKPKLCKKLGVNLMVEDSIDYALAIAERGIRVLLFERPWNKDGSGIENKNITRVKTWGDILGEVK